MLYNKARILNDGTYYLICTYTREERDKSKPLHIYTIEYPERLCVLRTQEVDEIGDFITETFNKFGAFNYKYIWEKFEKGVFLTVKEG